MPNENLKRMLDISKKMEESGNTAPSSKSSVTKPRTRMTEQQLDKQIDIWDEQVFGKSTKTSEGYDPHDEMEKIKNRSGNELSEKVLRNPILQEVVNNPYDFDIDVLIGAADPKRVEFDNTLKEKYGGISSAIKINETIDKKEKEKLEERKQQNLSNTSIDYNILRNMIEEILDNKLSCLNENINKPANKISTIMLDDNFSFIDNEGNIYKCTDLKYVGKAKIKK